MRTKLSHFAFELPQKLIAQYPAEKRDESKLMVLDRKTGKIEHRIFKDILEYFEDGDAMVFNNTKVFPARMYGRKEKTGAKIEVILERDADQARDGVGQLLGQFGGLGLLVVARGSGSGGVRRGRHGRRHRVEGR